jgi:hypothetical protein
MGSGSGVLRSLGRGGRKRVEIEHLDLGGGRVGAEGDGNGGSGLGRLVLPLVGEEIVGAEGLPAHFEEARDAFVEGRLLELLEDGLVLGLHHGPHLVLGVLGSYWPRLLARMLPSKNKCVKRWGFPGPESSVWTWKICPPYLTLWLYPSKGLRGGFAIFVDSIALAAFMLNCLSRFRHGQHHGNKDTR